MTENSCSFRSQVYTDTSLHCKKQKQLSANKLKNKWSSAICVQGVGDNTKRWIRDKLASRA